VQPACWMRVLLVFGLALIAPSLKANIIGPDGSGGPDVFALGFSYDPPNHQPRQVVAHLSGKWGTALFGGEFIEQVEADPANTFCSLCLDFLFQVDNESSLTENLTRVAEGGLLGFRTDVGYDSLSLGSIQMCGIDDGGFCNSGNPNTVPNTVDRQLTGDIVDFNFLVGVPPNESTVDLVIMTNSSTFTDPMVTFYGSNGDTGTAMILGPSGSPVSDVPEPCSLILFGSGLVLVTCLSYTATRWAASLRSWRVMGSDRRESRHFSN